MLQLKTKIGHDIITSSGDTLLGSDDKAGIAEIMAAVTYLANNPDLPRTTLRVGFTPDEEIGKGGLRFDIDRFGAQCAYTLDGADQGELSAETFTAAQAVLTIKGVDIHPGMATGKLVNAAKVAAQVVAALPSDRLTPETTSGREGFIHVIDIKASVGQAVVTVIIRDFDDDLLAEHIQLLRSTAEKIVEQTPNAKLEFEVEHQYPNMRKFLEPVPEVVEVAERAIEAEGIRVNHEPIRGGTDGSFLSSRGLPTPNMFSGQHEIHSAREWTTTQDLAASAATIVKLAGLWAVEPKAE